MPVLNTLWALAGPARPRADQPARRWRIGCVVLGRAFLVMIVAATDMPDGAKVSVLWLLASSIVFTVGEIYLSPIGLSFVTKVAPLRMVSMMMGVWYLSSFVGNYLTGYLGTYYEKMPHTRFFWMLAVIAGLAGLALFAMNRPLDRIVGAHDRHEPGR